MSKSSYKRSSMIYGIIFLMLACIPREDPPEKGLYLEKLKTLPSELTENSGMTESNGLIWIINDSGNEPALYGYNSSNNTVERKVMIKGLPDTDWEDVTQNNDYLLIGDFGNNLGNRTDLKIIMISKADLVAEADTVTPYGIIAFHYADQTDFTPANENTRYDCEAFISTNDQILLFTKDWIDQKTRIYSLPVTPGNYEVSYIDEWKVEGLITAAGWSPETGKLYLLGYTPAIPFLWVYDGFDPENVTYSSSKRTDFMNFMGTQTEGLMISDDGSLYISAEGTSVAGPAIFKLKGN